MAYVDLADPEDLSKAEELNGTEIGDSTLKVEKATKKPNQRQNTPGKQQSSGTYLLINV